MHEFNLIIIMSIASSVGWTAAIYDDDLPLSIGYFVASLVGAFMASYMALWFLPQYGNVGVVLAALIGAISLTAALRIFRKKKS